MADEKKVPGNGKGGSTGGNVESNPNDNLRGFSMQLDRATGLVKPGFFNKESIDDMESLIVLKHFMNETLRTHISMLLMKKLDANKSKIEIVKGNGGILGNLKNKLDRSGKLKM